MPPASIFPPNILKDGDDDRRKKMFLVKKRADMHGNCMRGRKEATRERIKKGTGEEGVGGRKRNPDSYKKRRGEAVRKEMKGVALSHLSSHPSAGKPKRSACLHATTNGCARPHNSRNFVAGFSRSFTRQP